MSPPRRFDAIAWALLRTFKPRPRTEPNMTDNAMTLEPHHRAGHTRSWREDEAIAAWATRHAQRPPESPVAPSAPMPPAEPHTAPDGDLGASR